MSDTCSNIIIGLITGFVSGIISGLLVTIYYKCRDKKESTIKRFFEDRYAYYMYLREIKFELELFMHNEDSEQLLRILANYPHFDGFGADGILNEVSHAVLDKTLITLEDLERKLKNKDLTKVYLHETRATLGKLMLGMLGLRPYKIKEQEQAQKIISIVS